MRTSVRMIENYYGHINPVKNAERILQGMPGWEPIGVAPQVAAEAGRVNAGAAQDQAARPRAADAANS
jgi:integrase